MPYIYYNELFTMMFAHNNKYDVERSSFFSLAFTNVMLVHFPSLIAPRFGNSSDLCIVIFRTFISKPNRQS